MKKILVVMAHPDDESFGPGATIAKYAAEGIEIHLLCATRGESGKWSGKKLEKSLGEAREKEHRAAAKILGIKKLEYLGYVDGYLSDILVGALVEKVRKKVQEFEPEILLTFDLLGLSGHIDHMTMAMVTTKVFWAEEGVKKLYYYAFSQERAKVMRERYHRGAWGRDKREITTLIDIRKFFSVKIVAAELHASQRHDFEVLLPAWKQFGKEDLFVLGGTRVKTKLPERDLFAGIK